MSTDGMLKIGKKREMCGNDSLEVTRMPEKIKVGVILFAGKGERLGVKTIDHAKPLLDIAKETIGHRIVLSFLDAGIKEIVIVCSPEQIESVKRQFSPSYELQKQFATGKRGRFLGQVERVWEEASIQYVVQDPEQGKGDEFAIASAYKHIFRRPFVLAFGDALFQTADGANAVQQVVDCYQRTNLPVVLLQEVAPDRVSNFGVAELENPTESETLIKRFVEKPRIEEAPSNKVAVGMYVVTPEVLQYLPLAPLGADGELRYADVLVTFSHNQGKYIGLTNKGEWYDTGDQQGLEVARLHFGLQDPDIGKSLTDYLEKHGWKKG